MEFQKILISRNQTAIDNEINKLQRQKVYFQSYVDKLVFIGIEVQENDLIALFEDTKGYITDKLTHGESLQVGGLTLNKEKVFDLIEKPVGTNEIIESILKDQQDKGIREGNIWFKNRFIITNNKVVISEATLEQITEGCSTYVTSQNQKTGFEKMQQIATLLNEVNQLNGIKINIDTELEELLRFNNNTDKLYEVNPTVLKRFN